MRSVESVHRLLILLLFHIYFYFLILLNNKVAKAIPRIWSYRKIHPGMNLYWARDILSHSGTVPGIPGHLVTLCSSLTSLVTGCRNRRLKSFATTRQTYRTR